MCHAVIVYHTVSCSHQLSQCVYMDRNSVSYNHCITDLLCNTISHSATQSVIMPASVTAPKSHWIESPYQAQSVTVPYSPSIIQSAAAPVSHCILQSVIASVSCHTSPCISFRTSQSMHQSVAAPYNQWLHNIVVSAPYNQWLHQTVCECTIQSVSAPYSERVHHAISDCIM